MKILLDECVTKKLKRHLTKFEIVTVVEMNWSGLKNGKLLSVAVADEFDILLTIDKNLEHQQNINNYEIAVVVFDAEKSKIIFCWSYCRNSKNGLANLRREKFI